ncbi:T9SS type B sorting domain-containing protein [Lutibacter sp.]|uniref:T9SS type B sorting domain-containing protein n=1 Tax=Lutibacter sp. TaxID=1925666 RepID=UPI002732E1E8|nr:T9SS type B sorting domain-containing protein [Lutibacter sp.]MDP3312016.1 T9SS type B sorting domain-containing protein [Lutibacter sp.]
MKKYFVFFLFFLFTFFDGFCQSNCTDALPVCTNANSGGVVNGFGFDDFFGRSTSGCLKNGLGVTTIETNSFWFRVKLAASGEFGFNIKPNNLSEDWDFAVYGPNPICGALGTPIACNYDKVSTTGYTGVGEDPSGNPSTAYESWMNVTTGQEFVVLVNQYSGTNAGFSIEWKGAVIDNYTAPLDCEILLDLGPDRNLCEGKTSTLNATVFGPSISYRWFLFNTLSGAFEPMVPSRTTAAIVVNTTGRYKVEVTDNTTGVILEDDINITFNSIPIATTVGNMALCDVNGDGIEGFNLDSNSNVIINGQPNMTVTYHTSQLNAQVGVNALSSPYISGSRTIWARLENSTTKCFDLTSFEIAAVPTPIPVKPPDLYECDDNLDGVMIFNLNVQTPIILNGQVGVITYYEDQANAINRKGWIVNTASHSSQSRTIWVRIEPSAGSSCYQLISFELIVIETPIANSITNLLICDTNNDGFHQFDFRATIDSQILKTQSPLLFEVNYFSSLANANTNSNALVVPYINVTPYAQERIFVRIQNKNFINCYKTTSFTLQVFDTPIHAPPNEIPILSYCDNNLDGNDRNGFIQFNLDERKLAILKGQSAFVFKVDYYEDAGYTKKITNPLTYTNKIAGGGTIYVRVSNGNANNILCNTDTSFQIEVRQLPNALLTPFDLIQCDEDGVTNGITDFNLGEADEYVTLGNPNLNVTYHLTSNDAASDINILDKFPFSNGRSPIVFARVSNINGCYRIVQINLSVSISSFPLGYMHEIVACDDDNLNDGVYTFNLAQSTSEILSLFTNNNLRLSFFRNQTDALLEKNSISNTSAYLNEIAYSQTIWVRVESSIDGGCFGIAPVIHLKVNPRPKFDLDETGIICLNNKPLRISTYNSNGIYTYEWRDNSGTIVSIQPFADILKEGVYSVYATSNLGCKSFIKKITIQSSNIASLDVNNIEITETSNYTSVSITGTNQDLGIGLYEFAIDDALGTYQDNSVFLDVIPGIHTIYVRDQNGCGTAQVTFYVFGFPKFFTPNDDGQNDYWNVRGLDPSVIQEAIIYIYDRYGKMLTTFNAYQSGWDGFYNTKKANSSDYWYLAKMIDFNGVEIIHKGHFSLIRR